MIIKFLYKARRTPPDGHKSVGIGLLVHGLRDHVENNQTGSRAPRILYSFQKIRRSSAQVRSYGATVRVFGSDDRRFRNNKRLVQQTASEKDLNQNRRRIHNIVKIIIIIILYKGLV